MKYTTRDDNTYVSDLTDFDLAKTLECGQCFHFARIADNEYGIVYKENLLHAKMEDGTLILYDTDSTQFENIWLNYFDLTTDYKAIKKRLLEVDEKLTDAIDNMGGVRILKQEFFETLISFIISQNKQIPHIKQLVFLLSEKYGKYVGSIGGIDFYSFPSVDRMNDVTLEELYECKTGFRAPYIKDAVTKVYDGFVTESILDNCDDGKCMETLMSIKGVGSKVANCVMLFSLGRRSAFPVDVWIKRICEEMYFGKQVKKEVIEEWARARFKELGGYAQQYLFYYGKENKIGKNSKSEKNEEK